MNSEIRVDVVGDIVVARISGEPTEHVLRDCQNRVLSLVRREGRGRVLYDALEMLPPPVDVPWAQRELDETLHPIRLRRPIVVPNSKLAYLARLAFGDGDYRVFYNDLIEAMRWLSEEDPERIEGMA